MKKITKFVCVAMALVILVCSTSGATASAAKRIYFAGEYRCKLGPGEYYVLQLNQYSSPEGKEVGNYSISYLYTATGKHPWGDGVVKKTSQKNVYRLGKMKMKVFKKKVVIKNGDADGVYKLKKIYYSSNKPA